MASTENSDLHNGNHSWKKALATVNLHNAIIQHQGSAMEKDTEIWDDPHVRAQDRLVGQVVKASASRAEGPGFESRLRRDFFGVESYQWLKHWHSSGYPARRLAL